MSPGVKAEPSDGQRGTGALVGLACLALALFATAAVLPLRGWPYNHDALSAFERTEWFRRAFAAGDLLPTWTPFCFNGHGSPGPFFYHRLFYSLSGALALATGSVLVAVVLSTVTFLLVGGLGMARLGAHLGWPTGLRIAAAGLLVLAPYTFTDWLVRGALAELSAGMLVPWLFLHALRVMRGERAGVALGAVWALMFYAHIVIWLFAGLALAIAFAWAAFPGPPHEPPRWRRALANLWRAALVTAIASGPYALGIRRLGRHFDLDQLRIYLPTRTFQVPKRYLFVPSFAWGEQWQGFSVEIGRGVLVGLMVLLPVAILARRRPSGPALALAGLSAAACLFLQLPLSAPFYLHVPLAEVIQFPWRLLTLITPSIAILFCELAATAGRSDSRPLRLLARTVVVAVLAWQLLFAASAQRIRYAWFERAEIARAMDALDGPWAGGEFLVRGVGLDHVPARAPFLRLGGCSLVSSSLPGNPAVPFHFTRVELEVESREGCRIRFSQFATPFIGVEGTEGVTPRRAPDGTVAVDVPPGRHRVVLRRRGVLAALLADLRAR